MRLCNDLNERLQKAEARDGRQTLECGCSEKAPSASCR